MRALGCVVAVAVVVLVVVSGVGGVAADGTQTAANASTDSYEELSEPGMTIEGKDPSSRYLGTRGNVFVSYQETNWIKELSEVNEKEWATDKVITPGKTVDTESVTMHVSRFKGAPPETVHVHVVTWDKTTRTVEEGNSTTQVPAATNVTEQVKEVSLTGGGDTVEVSLPHTDDPQQVTMWVEEYPSARWTFSHDPVATTNQLPFGSTWAGFLPWFALRFLLVTVVGVPVAIGAAIKTLDKTGGVGPGKGAAFWIIVPGMLLYAAGYVALGTITSVIVSAPYVLALAVVAIAYVATLEYADSTFSLLIEQLVTTEDINALGEDVREIEGEKGAVFAASRLDGSRYALVKKGNLKAWLLVALTDASWPVIDISDLNSRVDYEKGSSAGGKVADAKLYADEAEHEVIRVQWPSLDISLSNLKVTRDELPGETLDGTDAADRPRRSDVEVPETVGDRFDREKLGSAVTSWAIGTLVGAALLGNHVQGAALGTLPVLWTMSEVRDGWAWFDAAPEHSTPAKATRVAEQHELTVARTFEELQQDEVEGEANIAETAMDIVDARTKRQREQLQRLLGVEDSDMFGGPSAGRSRGGTRAEAATDGGTDAGPGGES